MLLRAILSVLRLLLSFDAIQKSSFQKAVTKIQFSVLKVCYLKTVWFNLIRASEAISDYQ